VFRHWWCRCKSTSGTHHLMLNCSILISYKCDWFFCLSTG
jgi:hypothetical protein